MPSVVDWRLRLRTLLSVCVIFLVNALLLTIALVVFTGLAFVIALVGTMIAVVTVGELPGMDVAIGGFVLLMPFLAVIGGIIALWWQVRHGARTVVNGLDAEPVDGEGPRKIRGRVRRLAAQADVATPSVAVVEEAAPTCLTVRVERTPTVLVTTGLLETLDDDELDAVLAHEITHIANRDVFLATMLASTVVLSDRLFERERAYRDVVWVLLLLSMFVVTILVFGLPLLLFALLYIVVSVLGRIVLVGNAITLGLFAQAREYAADSGACALTGEPAALASALRTIDGETPPAEDGRLRATAALGVVPQAIDLRDRDELDHWLANWLDSISVDDPDNIGMIESASEQSSEPGPVWRWLTANVYAPIRDAVGRIRSWRPATHPPTDKRIERIRRW